MTGVQLTKHAEIRANQRGFQRRLIAALMEFADVAVPVGGGCSALRLSKSQLSDREVRAALGGRTDRLAGVMLICDDETGQVVTILHDRGGAEARRYRRLH